MIKYKNKKLKEKFAPEIEELSIKELKLFESIDGEYNSLGFSVNYMRVPNGLIRTVINSETISQVFIPVNQDYFVN